MNKCEKCSSCGGNVLLQAADRICLQPSKYRVNVPNFGNVYLTRKENFLDPDQAERCWCIVSEHRDYLNSQLSWTTATTANLESSFFTLEEAYRVTQLLKEQLAGGAGGDIYSLEQVRKFITTNFTSGNAAAVIEAFFAHQSWYVSLLKVHSLLTEVLPDCQLEIEFKPEAHFGLTEVLVVVSPGPTWKVYEFEQVMETFHRSLDPNDSFWSARLMVISGVPTPFTFED